MKAIPYKRYKVEDKYTIPQMQSNRVESHSLIDNDSGEILKNISVISPKSRKSAPFVDVQPFIKLYDEGIKLLPTLKAFELILVCHIMRNIKPHQSHIELYPELLIEEYKKKPSTIRLTLLSLRRKNIISITTVKDLYEINPNIFYNGSRLKLITQQKNGG